jgi:hypothetical protein
MLGHMKIALIIAIVLATTIAGCRTKQHHFPEPGTALSR